jgi:hypothetical protein
MWLICMRSCICLCAGRFSSLFDDFPTSIPWSTLKIRFFLLPVSHNEYMLLLMVSKGDMPPAQFALWIVMLTCASTAVGHSYPAPPLFISILLRLGAVSVCCCWLHVSTLKCRYQVNWYRSRALRHIRKLSFKGFTVLTPLTRPGLRVKPEKLSSVLHS